MADHSAIEWTDATWNPVRGCSRVSAGCLNCYAERQAIRHAGPGGAYESLVAKTNGHPVWTGKIRLVHELLGQPLRWKKPRRVFVNSMSDLFHPNVPDEFIDQVFAVMALCPEHSFQILTKRPERMSRWFGPANNGAPRDVIVGITADRTVNIRQRPCHYQEEWPLPNVWLGVSCEDQATADERIPLLLQTPAAVRFVSFEPLLGPINCSEIPIPGTHGKMWDLRDLQWVIVGGESGPRARPCDVAWIRAIVQQCQEARVPKFVKQLGAKPIGWCRWNTPEQIGYASALELVLDGESGECVNYEAHEQREPCPERCVMFDDRKGGTPEEWPADLRVREYPAR